MKKVSCFWFCYSNYCNKTGKSLPFDLDPDGWVSYYPGLVRAVHFPSKTDMIITLTPSIPTTSLQLCLDHFPVSFYKALNLFTNLNTFRSHYLFFSSSILLNI